MIIQKKMLKYIWLTQYTTNFFQSIIFSKKLKYRFLDLNPKIQPVAKEWREN